MSEKKDLTILQFTADNVTNLKAVRITPDKKVVVLTGANEAGKSNILDVIQDLIEGLKLKLPIREGEERGDATIDLGDLQIRKRWTAKGEGLEVSRMIDGNKQVLTSPRKVLDELTGKMVDPMKLLTLMKNDPRKFRDTLAKLVGLDLTDLKDEEAWIRSDRKLINDKIRDAVAQLKELDPPDPDTPDEEMTFKEKLDEVNRLREKRQNLEDIVTKHQVKEKQIQEVVGRVEAITHEISTLEKERDMLFDVNKENNEQLGQLEERISKMDKISLEDITAAEAEIEQLETKNVEIREAKRFRQKVKESQKFQKESDAFSEKLSRIEQDKQTRVASCKFPVDGLSLTENTVLYDGKPLDVASSGRQIRVFTRMALALAPETSTGQRIKVLLVRDGSLLDSEGFKEMCQIVDEVGGQIWLERVEETGKVGIFIENGEVKAVDGTPIPEERNDENI